MTRKFRFNGYGNRKPCSDDATYGEVNPDTEYFFTDIVLTPGKIYEARWIDDYDGSRFPDAQFVDDEGTPMTQELRFFTEIFDEGDDWIDTVSEPSPLELAVMDASAEELRLQFE